jgi:transcription initiation factor TFIID subunit 12
MQQQQQVGQQPQQAQQSPPPPQPKQHQQMQARPLAQQAPPNPQPAFQQQQQQREAAQHTAKRRRLLPQHAVKSRTVQQLLSAMPQSELLSMFQQVAAASRNGWAPADPALIQAACVELQRRRVEQRARSEAQQERPMRHLHLPAGVRVLAPRAAHQQQADAQVQAVQQQPAPAQTQALQQRQERARAWRRKLQRLLPRRSATRVGNA